MNGKWKRLTAILTAVCMLTGTMALAGPEPVKPDPVGRQEPEIYIANRMPQALSRAIKDSRFSIQKNQAVMPATIDNMWIHDRTRKATAERGIVGGIAIYDSRTGALRVTVPEDQAMPGVEVRDPDMTGEAHGQTVSLQDSSQMLPEPVNSGVSLSVSLAETLLAAGRQAVTKAEAILWQAEKSENKTKLIDEINRVVLAVNALDAAMPQESGTDGKLIADKDDIAMLEQVRVSGSVGSAADELEKNGTGQSQEEQTVEKLRKEAQSLLNQADAAAGYAREAAGKLTNPSNIAILEGAIEQAEAMIREAREKLGNIENLTQDELAAFDQNTIAAAIGSLYTLADSLLNAEKAEPGEALPALEITDVMGAMGLSLTDVITFAANSGFTLNGLISFFRSRNITVSDLADLVNTLASEGYSIQDFIEAGVLTNEGAGAFVVNLVDKDYGIAAEFTSASGTTYQFCGAAILSNGAQIQLGNPMDHSDPTQQFGFVTMDGQGTQCFFSTIGSEKLGLFPGEMLVSRQIVIDGKVYWFDETGAYSLLGTLDEVDPNRTGIGKEFADADYPNGLPAEADQDTFPRENLVHSFRYTTLTKPSCTKKGLELIQCRTCSLQMRKEIPPTGHKWLEASYTWSEDKDGCMLCEARQVCANDAAHTLREKVKAAETENVPASCEAPGKITWQAAFTNGAFTAQKKSAEIPAIGHDYGEWSGNTATCTEGGTETRTCQREGCGKTETQATEALGHNMTPHAAAAATCTMDGNNEYWYCDQCKQYFGDAEGKTTIPESSRVIGMLGHDFGAWGGNTATCTEGGTETRICQREGCSATETRPTEALGHNMNPHAAAAATCTTNGNSAYWYCERCKQYFSDAEGKTTIPENSWVIGMLGHDFGAWGGNTATCTEGGTETRTCQREGCAETETRATEALGHNMTPHAAAAATCTTNGNSAYWYCERCKQYFSDAEGKTTVPENSWVISKLGHDFGAWSGNTATCTEGGTETRTCQREGCGVTETQATEALGHDLTPYEAVAATCTNNGNTAYWYCGRCRKYYKDAQAAEEYGTNGWVTSAPDNHDWQTPVWTWEGVEKAKAVFTCKRDSSHQTEVSTTTITLSSRTDPDIENNTAGKSVYSAAVTLNGQTYTGTKEVTFQFTPDIIFTTIYVIPEAGVTVKSAIENAVGYGDYPAEYNGDEVTGTYTVPTNSQTSQLTTDAAGTSFTVSLTFTPDKSNAFRQITKTFTIEVESGMSPGG